MIDIKSYAKAKGSDGGVGGTTSTATYSYGGGGSTSKLDTMHYIWEHPFNGTQDVTGDLTVPNLSTENNLSVSGQANFGGGGYITKYSSLYLPYSSTDDEGTEHLGEVDIKSSNVTIGDPAYSYRTTTKIYGNTRHGAHVFPTIDDQYNLGGSSLRWSNLYAVNGFLKNLTVTGSAHFFELIIDKIKAAGGSVLFTPCDGFEVDWVSQTNDGYKLYWRADDDDKRRISMWQVGDQALCQNFNQAKVGASYNVDSKYYWCLVTEVSDSKTPETLSDGNKYHYIVISNTDCDGTVNPSVGDNIVMCGYRGTDDAARQSAIYISAYKSLDIGLTAPLFAHYTRINNFDLASHRTSYWDVTGAKFIGNFELTNGKQIEEYMQEQIEVMSNYVDKKIADINVTIPYIEAYAYGQNSDGETNNPRVYIHNGTKESEYDYIHEGISHVVINRNSLEVVEELTYDTYSTPSLCDTIVTRMDAYNNAYFHILLTSGRGGVTFTQTLLDKMCDYGGDELKAFTSTHAALAFIGYKGAGKSATRTDYIADTTDYALSIDHAVIKTFVSNGNIEVSRGAFFQIDQVNLALTSRISNAEGDISTIRQTTDGIQTSVAEIGKSISTINQTSSNITQEIKDMKTGLVKAGINIDGDTSSVTITGSVNVQKGNGVYIYDDNGNLRTQVASGSIGSYGDNTQSRSGSITLDGNTTLYSTTESPFTFNIAKGTEYATRGGYTFVMYRGLPIDGLNTSAKVTLSNFKCKNFWACWSNGSDFVYKANTGNIVFTLQGMKDGAWVDLTTSTVNYSSITGPDITLSLSLQYSGNGYTEYRIHFYSTSALGALCANPTRFYISGVFYCDYLITYADANVNKIGNDGFVFSGGTNRSIYFGEKGLYFRWGDTVIKNTDNGLVYNTSGNTEYFTPLTNKIQWILAQDSQSIIFNPTQYNMCFMMGCSGSNYINLTQTDAWKALANTIVTFKHSSTSGTLKIHSDGGYLVGNNGFNTPYYDIDCTQKTLRFIVRVNQNMVQWLLL